MKNLCYETLNIIEAEINKKIGFSYNILDKYALRFLDRMDR